MWEIVNQDLGKLERCLEIVKHSAEHYNSWDIEKFRYLINRKNGEFYYYSDKKAEIVLAFLQNQTYKTWRIKHTAFIGDDPKYAIGVAIKKIKEFLKSKNQTAVYGFTAPLNEYKNGNDIYLGELKNISNTKNKMGGLEWQLNI